MGNGKQPAPDRFRSTVAAPNPIEFDGVEKDDHVDAVQIENPFCAFMQQPVAQTDSIRKVPQAVALYPAKLTSVI